jgi:mono/diheme cytochrome c family protein
MTGAVWRAGLTGLVVIMLGVASVASWSTTEPPRSTPDTGFSGATLFQTKGCTGCHTGPDAESRTNVGPDLRLLPDVASERRPDLPAEDYIRESILTPQAFIVPGFEGGASMPTLQLEPDEVDAIVEYLTDP